MKKIWILDVFLKAFPFQIHSKNQGSKNVYWFGIISVSTVLQTKSQFLLLPRFLELISFFTLKMKEWIFTWVQCKVTPSFLWPRTCWLRRESCWACPCGRRQPRWPRCCRGSSQALEAGKRESCTGDLKRKNIIH